MARTRRSLSYEDAVSDAGHHMLLGSIHSSTLVTALRRHAVTVGVLFTALYIVLTTVYVGSTNPHHHHAPPRTLVTLPHFQDLPTTPITTTPGDIALASYHHLHPAFSPCDHLLQLPKVAMLFLTPGKLPHERLWREWLEGATGLLPIPAVTAYARRGWSLDRARLAQIQEACTPRIPVDADLPLAQRQHLFTLYVHTHPSFRGYRNFSMFAGHIIPKRIVGLRGHHSLTIAERLLLGEALKNPLNQRFYLVSETTLPMYPAAFIWEQAMAEQVSRVDACHFQDDLQGNFERWKPEMETLNFKKHHWRKTSQWFSLLPLHAQLVMEDEEINDVFEKYCFPYMDLEAARNVSCSSNEHYIAIVLAVNNRSNETACWGGGNTHVDWTRMNEEGRPRSWSREEICDDIILKARSSDCKQYNIPAALKAASKRFIAAAALPVGFLFPSLSAPRYPAIGVNCSLFMRKFSHDTSIKARETFRPLVQWPPRLT